jgi:hypothetical protein
LEDNLAPLERDRGFSTIPRSGEGLGCFEYGYGYFNVCPIVAMLGGFLFVVSSCFLGGRHFDRKKKGEKKARGGLSVFLFVVHRKTKTLALPLSFLFCDETK